MENKELITEFYSALAELNEERMTACYHPEVTFEDPAFGILQGEDAANMWRMLCRSQKGKDFRVSHSVLNGDEDTVRAHVTADYYFGKNKRKVHNEINASFIFRDGLIIDHRDVFDLYKWARQAMGTTGILIGWTPLFRKKLHRQTRGMLEKFIRSSH